MRKSNDQTLKEVLKEFAEQKKFKNKLNSKKLETLWFELFSSLAGSYTDKVQYANGVMTVFLSSSSLRKELLINKKLILQQINSKLKEETLNDIEFR
ncbi:MAG: DciA family protein [Saprospiraceae bacterium]